MVTGALTPASYQPQFGLNVAAAAEVVAEVDSQTRATPKTRARVRKRFLGRPQLLFLLAEHAILQISIRQIEEAIPLTR